MNNNQLLDYLYNKYMLTEELAKELRKRMIFARAHLCSSSLIQWIQMDRREILSKLGKGNKYYEKARSYLTNHPDSIDGYLVKTLGDESMYNIEKRMKLTDKDYEELLIRSQRLEKFIKESLEKGTEFEGEFDKRFSEMIRHEEKRWEDYEIIRKIKNKERMIDKYPNFEDFWREIEKEILLTNEKEKIGFMYFTNQLYEKFKYIPYREDEKTFYRELFIEMKESLEKMKKDGKIDEIYSEYIKVLEKEKDKL